MALKDGDLVFRIESSPVNDQDTSVSRASAFGDELLHGRLGFVSGKAMEVEMAPKRELPSLEAAKNSAIQAVGGALNELVGVGDIEVRIAGDQICELGEDFRVFIVDRDMLRSLWGQRGAYNAARVLDGLNALHGRPKEILVAGGGAWGDGRRTRSGFLFGASLRFPS